MVASTSHAEPSHQEYKIAEVNVDLLSAWRAAKAPFMAVAHTQTSPANVYVWIASQSMLEPNLWSFQDFMRDKAHRWIGHGAEDAEYAEVDRRRQMEGKIRHRRDGSNGEPQFGHAMRQHFALDPDYINLNHGGVGAAPQIVLKARREWQGWCSCFLQGHFNSI